MFDGHPTHVVHVRRILGAQRQQHHALMQHLVVLQVVQQRKGMTLVARDANTAVPGTRTGGDFSSEAIIASSELPCSCRRRSEAEALALRWS